MGRKLIVFASILKVGDLLEFFFFPKMPQQLKKIVRIPLRDQILDSIKRAIITGKFRASEKISEEELAEQLGVSRTPIREAIRVLEQQLSLIHI